MTLDKMAPVATGDIVRIRETVAGIDTRMVKGAVEVNTIPANGKLRNHLGIVRDVFDSPDAAQGQIVFVDVLVIPSSGVALPDVCKLPVKEPSVAFAREQIRPLYRPADNPQTPFYPFA